jgi:uncharacterized protein YutE (UPF0331/DUF86 family)
MEELWRIIKGLRRLQMGGVKILITHRYLADACERAIQLAAGAVVDILREIAKSLKWRTPASERELVLLFKKRGVLDGERARMLLKVLEFANLLELGANRPVTEYVPILPREVYEGIRVLRLGIEEVTMSIWDFAESRGMVLTGGAGLA